MTGKRETAILWMSGGTPNDERKRKGGTRTIERAGRREATAAAYLRDSTRRAILEGIHRTRRATAAMR